MAKSLKQVVKTLALGENVVATVVGSKLTIEIDLARNSGKSASGKNFTVASTRGNQVVPAGDGSVVVGINCFTRELPHF